MAEPPGNRSGAILQTGGRCSGPASFSGKRMSRWPLLLKHLSYIPVNPFDSFHTWRESTDPTFSNSLDYFRVWLSSESHGLNRSP